MILEYKVTETNQTINQILKNRFHFSARLFSKLINNKKIYLNSNIIDTRTIVQIGEIIKVDLNYNEDNSNIISTKIALDIIYEDEWMLILNKPAGIAVHPSMLHYDDSLSNGVKFYFDTIGLNKKIRPVNRLDYDTSGLIIFAKCEYIQEELIRQMKTGKFKKEYLCLAQGTFKTLKGIINAPISRKEKSIIERCIDKDGKTAITEYEVLKDFGNYSLVKCILKTGRTHQIRVHLSFIGHPLLGDTLYGDGKSNIIDRQALHSYKISFIHPIILNSMIFECKPDFI